MFRILETKDEIIDILFVYYLCCAVCCYNFSEPKEVMRICGNFAQLLITPSTLEWFSLTRGTKCTN